MPIRRAGPGFPWLRFLVGSSAIGALLLAVALMATPSSDPATTAAVEQRAIARLREVLEAELRFARGAFVDTDGDGHGEYGFLAELAGSARLRIDTAGRLGMDTLREPVLPDTYAAVTASANDDGEYVLVVFLPAPGGGWIAEAADGGGAGIAVDATAARQRLRAYAWPLAASAGRRAFSIDAAGTVLAFANEDRRYEDRDHRIEAGAIEVDGDLWRPLH